MYYLTVGPEQTPLPAKWTLSQVLNYQRQRFPDQGALRIFLHLDQDSAARSAEVPSIPPLTTLLEEFAALGGLAVLSQHLPMLLCASTCPTAVTFDHPSTSAKSSSQPTPGTSNQATTMNGMGVIAETIDSWVKLDGGSEDLDEEMEEMLMPPGYFPPPTPQSYISASINKRIKAVNTTPTSYALPLHSLAAFSLFLSMPQYTEAVLQDRRRAQMLLRLALGVSDDGQGGKFQNSLNSFEPISSFFVQIFRKHFEFAGRGSVSDPSVHPAAASAGQSLAGDGKRMSSAAASHRHGRFAASVGLFGRFHPPGQFRQRHHSG